MKHSASRKLSSNKIFLILLALDLLVLVLHLVLSQFTSFFHLDVEGNFPTLMQSTKLIVFGILLLYLSLARKHTREVLFFILPVSVFLTALGVDELFQLHENIYRLFEIFDWLHPSKIVAASMKLGYRSSLWILYYLPAIFIYVFWSGYWLHAFQTKYRSDFRLLGLSSLCLFAVVIAEILSSTGSMSAHVYFVLVTIEEAAEMLLATTLIYLGYKMGMRVRKQ